MTSRHGSRALKSDRASAHDSCAIAFCLSSSRSRINSSSSGVIPASRPPSSSVVTSKVSPQSASLSRWSTTTPRMNPWRRFSMNLRATFMPMSALPGLNAVPGGETRGALLRALIHVG